jgi:hypothetical protein
VSPLRRGLRGVGFAHGSRVLCAAGTCGECRERIGDWCLGTGAACGYGGVCFGMVGCRLLRPPLGVKAAACGLIGVKSGLCCGHVGGCGCVGDMQLRWGGMGLGLLWGSRGLLVVLPEGLVRGGPGGCGVGVGLGVRHGGCGVGVVPGWSGAGLGVRPSGSGVGVGLSVRPGGWWSGAGLGVGPGGWWVGVSLGVRPSGCWSGVGRGVRPFGGWLGFSGGWWNAVDVWNGYRVECRWAVCVCCWDGVCLLLFLSVPWRRWRWGRWRRWWSLAAMCVWGRSVQVAVALVGAVGGRFGGCVRLFVGGVGGYLFFVGVAKAVLAGGGPQEGRDIPWRQEGVADGVVPS